MSVWIGTAATVLALASLAGLALIVFARGELQEMVRQWERLLELQRGFVQTADVSRKAAADRLESSLHDLAAAVRLVKESFSALSHEIKTRAMHYDRAQRLAERQVAVIEYLMKLSKSMASMGPRRPGEAASAMTDELAAEIEKLTEEEKDLYVRAASGVDREWEEGA